VCPSEAIFFQDEVPEELAAFRSHNAEFFKNLASPGGASKFGPSSNDPEAVRALARADGVR
jgi:hypothetical protein